MQVVCGTRNEANKEKDEQHLESGDVERESGDGERELERRRTNGRRINAVEKGCNTVRNPNGIVAPLNLILSWREV